MLRWQSALLLFLGVKLNLLRTHIRHEFLYSINRELIGHRQPYSPVTLYLPIQLDALLTHSTPRIFASWQST
jgi:hypothetical protein